MQHYRQFNFAVWRGRPSIMSTAHTHSDIELNFLASGSATYFVSGRFRTLSKGQLALFWAGAPHQLTAVESTTEFVWVTVPLAWFLQWHLPVKFTERLLRGELIAMPQLTPLDSALLIRWAADFKSRKVDVRQIVTLEVEAYIRRLALYVKGCQRILSLGGGMIESLTQYISQHYTEELSVAKIAFAVGLHPNYIMQLFKRQTGLRLWDYVIRLRIAHAQRLLLTTEAKIIDVALESGFASVSRFYDAFQRISVQTPKKYRYSQKSPNRINGGPNGIRTRVPRLRI